MAPYPQAALVDELATVLQIKDDSYKALAEDLKTWHTVVDKKGSESKEERKVANSALTKMGEAKGIYLRIFSNAGGSSNSQAYTRAFFSQLGALYLPRLAQAFVLSVKLETKEHRIDFWAQFFRFVATLPIFIRFVREYPKESSEAMVAFMGRWELPPAHEVINSFENPTTARIRPSQLIHATEPLQLYLLSPTVYDLSPPESSTAVDGYHAAASPEGQTVRRELEALIKACDEHFSSSRPEWFAPGDGLRSRLKWVETLLRLGPDKDKKIAVAFAWSRCSGGEEGEKCEGSGGTMMMCGRCGAERYCGKAHQKSEWKTHKFECVTPAW